MGIWFCPSFLSFFKQEEEEEKEEHAAHLKLMDGFFLHPLIFLVMNLPETVRYRSEQQQQQQQLRQTT